MEITLVQNALPYGETYHSKVSFIDLLATFAFQKAPLLNCFLFAQLCSSGLSISAHSLWHMPFNLFIPFSFYSPCWDTGKEKQKRRLMCKIHMHTIHSLFTVLAVYPCWRGCSTAMFPDQTTCQISKLSLDIYIEFALHSCQNTMYFF